MSDSIPRSPDMDGVPVVYTNLLRTTPSPFDFSLDFGYIAPTNRVPDAPPAAQVRVVMTWEYAKILRDTLQEAIDTREGNVGEIGRPPGLIPVRDGVAETEGGE
jgi:hypothetical protein